MSLVRVHRCVVTFVLAALAVKCLAFSPEDVNASVRNLAKSPYVVFGTAGTSIDGRDIPFLVLTDRSVDPHGKMRVLIIAGQHGNEPAAPEGVMAMMRRLAFGEGADVEELRRKVILIVVPLVNPDGIALGTRENGAGVDLNRDWVKQTQQEVRAVTQLVSVWRPELFLDEHEWLDGDRGIANFIENCGPLASRIAHPIDSDPVLASFKSFRSRLGASRTLAHRCFAAHGIPAFLIETRQAPDSRRLWIYDHISVRIIASALRLMDNPPAGKEAWEAPEMLAVEQPVRTVLPKHSGWSVISISLLGSYLLIVAVLRSQSTRRADWRTQIVRMGGVLPRREHDIAYWMSRPGLTARSSSKRNIVTL